MKESSSPIGASNDRAGVETSGDAKRQIRTTLHKPTMQQRWKKQFGVNDSDEEFDWDVFKWICKSKPDWKKIWFAKHNARIGSVRTNLV